MGMSFLTSLLRVPRALAQEQRTLTVELGARVSFDELVGNIVTFLAGTIVIVSLVLFTAGALCIVLSRGEDPLLSRGKDLMIYSLVGLAVVLGSAGILQTIFYLVYST